MGAPGWEASLLHRGRTARAHSWPVREPDFSPWSPDGERYVILRYDEPTLQVHRIRSDEVSTPRLEGFPHTAQWAPNGDRLLVSLGDRALVLAGGTRRRAEACWRVVGYDPPAVFWLPPGDCFFVVGRESRRKKTQIRFYLADGTLIEALDLDPRDLAPYDEATFAHVPRGRYSLDVGRGPLAVGYLLDIWKDVRYDEEEGLLLLSVYRPTRRATSAWDALPCPVSKRWVAVPVVL